jgi:hypothetical protein
MITKALPSFIPTRVCWATENWLAFRPIMGRPSLSYTTRGGFFGFCFTLVRKALPLEEVGRADSLPLLDQQGAASHEVIHLAERLVDLLEGAAVLPADGDRAVLVHRDAAATVRRDIALAVVGEDFVVGMERFSISLGIQLAGADDRHGRRDVIGGEAAVHQQMTLFGLQRRFRERRVLGIVVVEDPHGLDGLDDVALERAPGLGEDGIALRRCLRRPDRSLVSLVLPASLVRPVALVPDGDQDDAPPRIPALLDEVADLELEGERDVQRHAVDIARPRVLELDVDGALAQLRDADHDEEPAPFLEPVRRGQVEESEQQEERGGEYRGATAPGEDRPGDSVHAVDSTVLPLAGE